MRYLTYVKMKRWIWGVKWHEFELKHESNHCHEEHGRVRQLTPYYIIYTSIPQARACYFLPRTSPRSLFSSSHKPALALTLSERACAQICRSNFARFVGVSFLRKRRRLRSSDSSPCFTAHKPTHALTLSERASSYYNALEHCSHILQPTFPRLL